VLDFGCGTGLSGQALHAAGFTTLDGTDITPGMLAKAETDGALPQALAIEPGDAPPPGYATIAAIGVVSLGAAPPARSPRCWTRSPPAASSAFSYNDATLADPAYMEALADAQARRRSSARRLRPPSARQGHGLPRLCSAQALSAHDHPLRALAHGAAASGPRLFRDPRP
jgi:SAM-dependent methyltransferase